MSRPTGERMIGWIKKNRAPVVADFTNMATPDPLGAEGLAILRLLNEADRENAGRYVSTWDIAAQLSAQGSPAQQLSGPATLNVTVDAAEERLRGMLSWEMVRVRSNPEKVSVLEWAITPAGRSTLTYVEKETG